MMKRLLGSMLGAQGGRLVGSMLGGRTGGMVGGLAGGLLGGGGASSIGNMLGGLMGGGNDKSAADSADMSESDAEKLIEVMANAAKADGQVDESEVTKILEGLGELESEQEDHLRKVLASPFVPASDIASDVSDSLGADAYVLSLISISIDDGKEVQYLKDLASGLGLSDEDRNAIHDGLELAHL